MHLMQCASADGHVGGFTFQDMTSSFAVLGQEVKVISGNAEGSGKSRRPKTNQRAFLVLERELLLSRRGGLQTCAVRDSFHDSSLYGGELSFDTKGVKRVLRRPKRIAHSHQFGEVIKLLRCHSKI